MENKLNIDKQGRVIIEDEALLETVSGAMGEFGEGIPPIVDDCNCHCE